MPLQPIGAELVADEVRPPENIAAEAGKACRVECRLGLAQRRAVGKVVGIGDRLRIKIVTHERFWRRGPTGAAAKVFRHQAAIGAKLEPAGALRHRRFDNLIADHQQRVARTGAGMAACDLPIRRRCRDRMVDGIGPPHGDAAPLQQRGEIVELAFRLVEQNRRYALAAERAPGIAGRIIR